MNVALFASAFHPHLGGVEEHVRQVAGEFLQRGARPLVVTNRWPTSLPAQDEFEGIPIYRLAMRIPEGSFKARLKHTMSFPSVRRNMFNVLRAHDVQAIHVHCVSNNGYYALLASRELGLPLIVSTHGERTMDATGLYDRSPFINQLLRELLMEADHVTACSQHTLEDIEAFHGRPFADRAGVVYNGVRPEEFDLAQPHVHSRPYILAVGRLVLQKGMDLLLEALAQAEVGGWDLLIAGDGPERSALQAQALRLNLSERVHFLGRTEHAGVVSLFKGCELFVLPSRMEPMGIVNLEAMSAGKPVIAAAVGGVPEIVLDQETGLLVAPENVPALAQAIARLARDASLRNQLGQAGRQRARQFSWSSVAETYLNYYRTCSGVAEPMLTAMA